MLLKRFTGRAGRLLRAAGHEFPKGFVVQKRILCEFPKGFVNQKRILLEFPSGFVEVNRAQALLWSADGFPQKAVRTPPKCF